jgi:hypothetical protein
VTQPCETCGRDIADGATFCVNCAHKLDAALSAIVEYQGLAYDLAIAISRQARIGSRDGARSTETPVAFDARASEAADHLKGVLAGWARIVAEETGAELPADTLAGIATFLRRWVGWLRHHQAGFEAWHEILDAVKDARRIVDRPAEKVYAGPCDSCGQALYARPAADYVTCRTPECEELTYPVEERRRWMLGQIEDLIGGASYVATVCTGLGVKVSPSTIRMWVKRHKLQPRHYNPPITEDGKPRPLYRVGDVIRVAAGEDIYATGKAG